MYQIGDRIVYGNNGVCLVERIGVPDFATFGKENAYYFLVCEEDNSRIYAPTDTLVPIRRVMTTAEAEVLLAGLPDIQVNLPSSRDHKQLSQYYQKLLQQHTAESLACVMKSIHARKKLLEGTSGRLNNAEESILKKTENHLCGELAVALQISSDEARKRLHAALRGK